MYEMSWNDSLMFSNSIIKTFFSFRLWWLILSGRVLKESIFCFKFEKSFCFQISKQIRLHKCRLELIVYRHLIGNVFCLFSKKKKLLFHWKTMTIVNRNSCWKSKVWYFIWVFEDEYFVFLTKKYDMGSMGYPYS